MHLTKAGQNMLGARRSTRRARPTAGLVRNDGGDLWVMGCKTEGKGKRYSTTTGGKTELYGCYEYTTESVEEKDERRCSR